MADSQKKIEIDQIPGYAALILISDGDIKLFKAGKRYQEFFALEERHEGKSVLVGLAASERRLLYEQIIGEISRRNDFSYVRKAFSKERGICWLRVKAVYLEEEELGPVYVAVAEDLEDGFSFRRQVISILGSIRKANRELETILNMMDSEVELTAKPRAGKKTPKMHRGGVGGSIENENPNPSRNPPKVFIRTFGYFDVFVNGKILDFPSRKGKELLAVLVDRRGGICSSEEAISILWENEPLGRSIAGRYRQTASRLRHTLEQAGIGDILISKRGGRCVDLTKFNCDLYQYLSGEEQYKSLFRNLYMMNYSWAESTLATLFDAERQDKKEEKR